MPVSCLDIRLVSGVPAGLLEPAGDVASDQADGDGDDDDPAGRH